METFDQFEQKALAEGRIDFDGVFAYQCVDLILQYAYDCFGIRGERGNAIDYWNDPSAILLTKFTKVQTTDVQRGDIVVLSSTNPLGHIMLGTGNQNGTQFEGVEQNGGNGDGDGSATEGNEIRTRWVAKSRILGVLRPNVPANPAPAPAAPVQTSAEGTYNVTHDIPGYSSSADAVNHTNQKVTVHAGNYHIFNQAHGMINVTSQPGVPGIGWINPADNAAPAPSAPAAPNANPYGYDGNSIIIQSGWGLSNAAQAAGWPDAGLPTRWAAIAALNGSDDWQTFNANLKAGQRIIVGNPGAQAAAPATPPAPQKPANIEYKKLDAPIAFVTKLNPTHVWQLDFVDDAHAAAAYDLPADAPFVAFGQAQRTDGDKPCYFMTEADFGSADTTGTPTNNRGVNTVDLKMAPASEPSVAAPAAQTEPTSTEEDQGEKIEVKRLPPNLDVKFNYKSFMSPQKYTVVKTDANIQELQGLTNEDGSLVDPNQQVIIGMPTIEIGGAFYEDATYKKVIGYRTAKSIVNDKYYMIPEADLVRDDDITDEELEGLMKDTEEMFTNAAAQGKKVLKAAANTEGFFARFFRRNKK